MYRIWWNRFWRRIRGRLERRFGGQNSGVLLIILMCFVAAGFVMIQERLIEVDRSIAVIKEKSGEADIRAFMMPDFMYDDADIQNDAGPAAAGMLALMCGCGEDFSAGEYAYMADKLSENAAFVSLYEKLKLLMDDIRYFPVNDNVPGSSVIAYEDSWFAARTYGGNRKHEGTDIMSVENVSGVLEIISVSDGIVENKGWLPQGGYRIGIRSSNGVYYYYAHLHSYAKGLEIGSRVSAGDILGYMGDTGYGEKEGTTGMFDVHLHFGIYFKEGTREISINPYYVLRYISAAQNGI